MKTLSQSREKGITTIITAVVLLILITLATFFSSSVLIFEQKTSGNQLRQQQAFEAAQAGMERALAWLQTRSASPAVDNWSLTSANACRANTDPGGTGVFSIYALGWSNLSGTSRFIDPNAACNRNMPTTLTIAVGNLSYTVTLQYLQTINTTKDMGYVRIVSQAQAVDAAQGGSAQIEQIVSIPGGAAGSSGAVTSPLVVKQCLGSITGNPDICPKNVSTGNANISGSGGAPDCATATGTTGVAVTTLQALPANPDDCLDMGHFTEHGGTRQFLDTATASVWDTLFPGGKLTESMVKELSAAGNSAFKYYDSSNAPNKIPPLGSASQLTIIYVDSTAGCVPLAPGDFYALIYYETTASCDLQGGGSADLTGTIASEGSITKFNSNTILRQSNLIDTIEKQVVEGANVFSRVPGTWKDY